MMGIEKDAGNGIQYTSYGVAEILTPGEKLKVECSIYLNQADIASLIRQGHEAVEAIRTESIAQEQKAFDATSAAARQWESHAAYTKACDWALDYLNTPEVTHTGNQWRETEGARKGEEISNRVYRMYWNVWENTKYDREQKASIPVAWYVTWCFLLNTRKEIWKMIAGQQEKRYTDKAAAMKYIEGRKKAYAKYFKEEWPAVPVEYKDCFSVHGVLLPGYRLESND